MTNHRSIEVARWTRWFAIECNNRVWRLAEATRRTSAEDDEMLHAAHAALPDAEERSVFDATFKVIPVPA